MKQSQPQAPTSTPTPIAARPPAPPAPWQAELLEAVREAYGPRVAALPSEAVANILAAAYESTVLRGLRDRNPGQIRSFRRHFEEALNALSDVPLKVVTIGASRVGSPPNVRGPQRRICTAAPAACSVAEPRHAGRRRAQTPRRA
jgi:hypothetical protein